MMNRYTQLINESGNYAVDEMILVKDVVTTAGSKILTGFKSLFSAEVIERLTKAGHTLAGVTPTGEFGLDLVGEFSNDHVQTGALKGAAAELVKDGAVAFALGVDQNGAPRRAAALSNIAFLKPTYGTVSRYGINSCAASGEQVGVYAKDAKTIAETLTVIAGHDAKDGTSLPAERYDYTADDVVSGKKVAVLKNVLEKADDAVKTEIEKSIATLKQQGVVVELIDFDQAELANIAWQILQCAETCNNISRYDGVKYGYRAEKFKDIDELYVNSRTEGLNFLTKAVILYGSQVLSKEYYADCYERALRARRSLVDALNALFENYDAVLLPVCSGLSYESYDMKDAFDKVYEEMIYTSLASITGMPALACGPVQFVGKAFDESTLLSLASALK